MARIEDIAYEDGYRIAIFLQNGHKITYNMKPKLMTARFRELSDWEIFKFGKISDSGKSIIWNDRTELSLDEILYHLNHF